jgi:hypothetical protein
MNWTWEKKTATILTERNWEEDEEGLLCWRRRRRMGVWRDKQDVDEREIEKKNTFWIKLKKKSKSKSKR